MHQFLTNLNFQVSIVAFGVNLFFALYVLLRQRGWTSLLNRSYSFLLFTFALWNAGFAFKFSIFLYCGILFVAPPLHTFLRIILKNHAKNDRNTTRFLWIMSCIFASSFIIFRQPKLLYQMMCLGIIAPVLIWGIINLFKRIRLMSPNQERLRFWYVLSSIIIAGITGFMTLLAQLGFNLPEFGIIGAMLFTILTSIAFTRERLIDVGKITVRAIVIIIFALIFWFLIGILGYWQRETPTLSLMAIALSALVLVILYEPVTNLLEGQAAKMLNRSSYLFLLQLERFSEKINSMVLERELIQEFAKTLRSSDRIRAFGLYLMDRDNQHLILFDGDDVRYPPGSQIQKPEILIETMLYRKKAVNRYTVAKELRGGLPPVLRRHRIALYRALIRFRSQICFPITFAEKFMGFLSLGFADQDMGFTHREEDALTSVTRQFASALAHARLVERKEAKDRLATLGQLATGLAHEIRNPLGTIKAAVEYLQPSEYDEDQKEFLLMIRDEVDRLNRFVERFLSYARPAPMTEKTHLTSLESLIRRIILMYSARSDTSGIKITADYSEEIGHIKIPCDAWIQILSNLLENAIQALKGTGQIIITAHINLKRKMLEIRVEDSGPGIPKADQESIMQPFVTTKEKGTGLGLAIVTQICENLDAKISVHSSHLGGAAFQISYPLNNMEDSSEAVK